MNVRLMARAALFAALCAVCAWISIPVPPVRFTLQTFALTLSLFLLGGKWGGISILLYLFLGAVGLPVFSGFRGGIGAMLDVTGGFLWGFALGALGYRLTERWGKIPAVLIFMLICYLCGCSWMLLFLPGTDIWTAVCACVVPYILPDAGKIALAWFLAKRLRKTVK